MLDNLVNRYSIYLSPGNILQNYYIKKGNNNSFSLSDGLFETMLSNESDFAVLNNAIATDLSKYKNKGFEIKEKIKSKLSDNDIRKLFKLKFKISGNITIDYLVSKNIVYYVTDISEYKNNNLYTERHVIMFTKEIKEYIGMFTLTIIDKQNISIGSIYISTSKQRLGYFTQTAKNDLSLLLPQGTSQINVFSILKKGLGFYLKMERDGYFQFTKGDVEGILFIK